MMRKQFTLVVTVILLFAVSGSAQSRKKRPTKAQAKVIEGTISRYECGDNCYLIITDKKGKEHTGLCAASPLCTRWNQETVMPDSYLGKRVRVTVGKGKQVDGAGDVMGTMDAFTKIQVLKAQSLTADLKKQLAVEMVKNAYNPEYFQECMNEAGGIDKIVDIKAVSLSNSDAEQYLITGKADTATCAFGARTPMHWIYEYQDGKFRMLADIGACDSVQVTSRRTNGYLDIKIGVWYYAGTKFSTSDWKFNGTTYECRTCGRD